MSVSSEITNAASATAQYQASLPTATGSASKLDSQAFMNLMMKQLQYQDPMEPVSNTEFIAQQAQFSQLSTTQDMSSNIASNNSTSQAMSLVGKEVTLTNPDDKTKTITGTVTSATMNGTKSTINVGGKDYALSYLKSVASSSTSSTGTATGTTGTAATDFTSWGKTLLDDITALPALLAKELKSFSGSGTSSSTTSDASSSST